MPLHNTDKKVRFDSDAEWFYTSDAFVPEKTPADENKVGLLVQAIHYLDGWSPQLSPEKQRIENEISAVNKNRSDAQRIPGVMKPLSDITNQPRRLRPVKKPVVLKSGFVSYNDPITKVNPRIAQRLPKPKKPEKPVELPHPPCVSCNITKSPCWRPSWSLEAGQLCNSCGLRYRKLRMKCSNPKCRHIPSKLEISGANGEGKNMKCLKCFYLFEQD